LATDDIGAMLRGYSGASAAAVLAVFASTLFVGSFLLFWIEPMFVKMLLPFLGGSPGVWNTAMVFFQAVLLAGYAYAHLTTRYLGARRQALLHIAFLVLTLLSLPVTAAAWSPPTDRSPIPWIIGLMTVSIGAPFFLVAATAPLLQHWFSRTGHGAARDPYFLYGASNLGSIVALIAYPAVIEPLWPLTGQNRLWAAGFAMLAVLIVLCALVLCSRRALVDEGQGASNLFRASAPLRWGERLHWIALAFVPSSLLLGVTSHIVTDVVSAPLLWVIPLALYLLSFVIVFARHPVLKNSWMVRALPYSFILIAITYSVPMPFLLDLPLHLLAFFVAAMVCHGVLARRRPEVGHLTEFYLCMSLGGVLGGLFNAILAPVFFDSIYEYPLALVLACLLVPIGEPRLPESRWRDIGYPAVLLAVLAIPMLGQDVIIRTIGSIGVAAFLAVGGIAAFGFRKRPMRFALGMLVLLVAAASTNVRGYALVTERSFFGVSKVTSDQDGRFRVLMHGTTVHGVEYSDPARWRETVAYYTPAGPVGQFFAALPGRKELNRVGVIGLGSGALTCFRQPQQPWTYFEIDPVIERLARDTRYFHFLAQCGPDSKVVLGDARQSLKGIRDRQFDLLILDAFSSDAIPVHLLTREALALYLAKLADSGVLLFHISNRNLDLAPIVANLVHDAGAVALHQAYTPPPAALATLEQAPSEWVAIGRRTEDLAFLADNPRWARLEPQNQSAVWTDDYSNLIGALKVPSLIGALRSR
jgi:hypothetical protein